jgi:hypothetical protein
MILGSREERLSRAIGRSVAVGTPTVLVRETGFEPVVDPRLRARVGSGDAEYLKKKFISDWVHDRGDSG